MATLNTTNIKHASSSSNNIVLASDGKVTFPQNTGNILQVVSTTKQDVFSQAGDNATYAAITGLSATITPANASNKILIQVQIYTGNTADDYANLFRLYKAGSHLTGASGTGEGSRDAAFLCHRQGDQNADPFSLSNSYLDTAGGTSAITYKLVWSGESGTRYLNRRGDSTNGGAVSSFTIMEVEA